MENRRIQHAPQEAYTLAVERFIGDAETWLENPESKSMPLRHRVRDCERVNGFAEELNRLHREKDTKGIRSYIAQLFFMLSDEEKFRK